MLNPLTDQRRDRRDALGGGGDLHQQVGAGDALVQSGGRGDRGLGVARQLRGDFDRHEPVAAVRVVEGRTQHRQRVGDVVHGQFPIGIPDRRALRR